MNRQDFRFIQPLRVRWSEVDMPKIVFNAHYLMYVAHIHMVRSVTPA